MVLYCQQQRGVPRQQLILYNLAMSAQKQSPLDHSHLSEPSSSSPQPPPFEGTPQTAPAAGEAEFEKNYPKNIFIPLIEYLTELGYREAYEKCVGRRSEFEGKNVVSLGSIHLLISQDWFLRNINREAALAHIANKILINSKIKKKLFHLLIAHAILAAAHADLREFKRRISREANAIARRPFPQDDLFAYPNAVIFLLHLFLKTLAQHAPKKGQLKMEEELEKLSLEEATPADAKGKNAGSKEEYKFYVKEIVHVLNGKGLQPHGLTDILQETRQDVLEREKALREKYQLVEGIPNWACFIEVVVVRCFEYKRKDLKITNFIFNEWINDCKTQMLAQRPPNTTTPTQTPPSPPPHDSSLPNNANTENYWETGAIEWPGNRFNWSAEPVPAGEAKGNEITAGKSKEFAPIILSNIREK